MERSNFIVPFNPLQCVLRTHCKGFKGHMQQAETRLFAIWYLDKYCSHVYTS